MTDVNGAVVWSADYRPFGQADVTVNTVANNFRFPGQYYDQKSGLHYNWHRYYDPGTGRYISADPIGLDGGMNLYAYVNGNPVNSFDPFGLAKYTAIVSFNAAGLLEVVLLCGVPLKPNALTVNNKMDW
jgi:RHS repeat-associated protein